MTDNERVLHTILSTCNKPYYACHEASDHVEMLNNRLDEIALIAKAQIKLNTKKVERNRHGQ